MDRRRRFAIAPRRFSECPVERQELREEEPFTIDLKATEIMLAVRVVFRYRSDRSAAPAAIRCAWDFRADMSHRRAYQRCAAGGMG
jgi:hypothetical protein